MEGREEGSRLTSTAPTIGTSSANAISPACDKGELHGHVIQRRIGFRRRGSRRRFCDGAVDTAAPDNDTAVSAPRRFRSRDRGESLANFLGLFSLGLGLAQVVMPGAMSKVVGVRDDDHHRMLMRLLGLREISHGVAVLANQQPEKAMWSRVAGDALDLALLGGALANSDNDRGRTLFAAANVLAVTALDVMAAKTLSMQPDTPVHQTADDGIVHTRKSVTVGAPIDEVYAFWRDFENFPRFSNT